jgi:hypothetical protein
MVGDLVKLKERRAQAGAALYPTWQSTLTWRGRTTCDSGHADAALSTLKPALRAPRQGETPTDLGDGGARVGTDGCGSVRRRRHSVASTSKRLGARVSRAALPREALAEALVRAGT